MTVVVRDATPADEMRWRELWAGYLAFYKVDIDPVITDATWRRVFDPASAIFMRVAEVEGEVLGFTLCLTHEGTWTLRSDCYLEDLFVDARSRGQGVGRALIEAVYAQARAGGAERVYWLTQTGNSTARRLYDQVADESGFVVYRKVIQK